MTLTSDQRIENNDQHQQQQQNQVHNYNRRDYVSLIEKIKCRIRKEQPFFSLEFFPPRTPEGSANLFAQFDRMRHGGPLFCDVTWHSKSNPPDLEDSYDGIDSVNIAGIALNYCGLDTLLHVTCVSQTRQSFDVLLQRVMKRGIRNLLILRGDIDESEKPNTRKRDFEQSIDMIRYIREKHGDYFTIAIPGYPDGHPESKSYVDDLFYLKAKVAAGADFVITQLFFEVETFVRFERDCRMIGVHVPIIPGIMPIQSYDSLRNILALTKLPVPEKIREKVESVKGDDEKIRNYGIESAVRLCSNLLATGKAPGIHFYTLNRVIAVQKILERINLWGKFPHKELPWRVPVNHKRQSEDVRPIFWSSRVKSYLFRTQEWDEFPNGRWGKSSSPAFGELRDYYLFIGKSKFTRDKKLQMWGEVIKSERDVWNVFHAYLSKTPNASGKQVLITPWNEDDLSPETSVIVSKLADLNRRGVLTINSQPNICCLPSDDPVHGWGDSNGYVFQKAYLEFFTSKANVMALKSILADYPRVNFHIMNYEGSEDYTNCDTNTPIAVTWGVFPGREVIQPTVVDPKSFKIWKDEAFGLWNEWSELYEEDSVSRNTLNEIRDTYYLVNLVDNDFPNPCCLWSLLDKMLESRRSA